MLCFPLTPSIWTRFSRNLKWVRVTHSRAWSQQNWTALRRIEIRVCNCIWINCCLFWNKYTLKMLSKKTFKYWFVALFRYFFFFATFKIYLDSTKPARAPLSDLCHKPPTMQFHMLANLRRDERCQRGRWMALVTASSLWQTTQWIHNT